MAPAEKALQQGQSWENQVPRRFGTDCNPGKHDDKRPLSRLLCSAPPETHVDTLLIQKTPAHPKARRGDSDMPHPAAPRAFRSIKPFNRTALPPPDVCGSTERRRDHPGDEQKHPESSEDGRHVIFMLCLLTCFELPSTTSSSCKALPRRKIHQRPRSGSMPPRQVSTQSIKNNMLPILSAMPKANFPSKAMPCHRGAFSLSR